MSTIRRTAAVAIALAATGLSMTATPALAATVSAPAVSMVSADASISLINPATPTSLTIHKYLGAPTGAVPNGQPVNNISLPTLQNVPFDVYNVTNPDGTPIDLKTNAGWAAATALQGKTVTSTDISKGYITGSDNVNYPIKLVDTVLTSSTGTAVFKPTAAYDSLYLGVENLAKVDAANAPITDSTGKTYTASSITPSNPFLVTLPMTNPAGPDTVIGTADDNTTWDYDIDVYPKNSSDSITKAIEDKGTISTADGTINGTDHTIDYTLTSSITPGLDGTQMGAYAVVDQMPEGTKLDAATLKITGTAGSTLTVGTDYTIWIADPKATPPTNTQATLPSTVDGPLVQFVMTQTGLDKLAAAKKTDPTATVVTTLTATATAASGDLNNTAYLIPSNSWWQSQTNNPTATYNPGDGDTPKNDNGTPVTPGNPSNTVDTHLGTATLTKVDAAALGTKLDGAVFDLYSAVIDRANMDNPTAADCTNVVANQANLRMTGMTTANGGIITMDGLQQSDYWNSAVQPTQKIVYCVVETKAPTGYNLNAEPTAFFVTDSSTTTAVDPAAAFTVKDEKSNLANNLPLTGGAGAGLLSLGGLVVVGGTLAARAASKKRREDEADELA